MIALFITIRAWFPCKDDLYNYEDMACVTAKECSSIYNYRAYNAIGRCLYAATYGDDKPALQRDGSYECDDDFYLKIDYGAFLMPIPPSGPITIKQ